MTSPHIGMVAEDGAEAIIPLSPAMRDRGKEVWEQAGQYLGANNGGGVNVGDINVEIRVDGSGSPAETVDEIARELALKLQQVFANLPIASEGAY